MNKNILQCIGYFITHQLTVCVIAILISAVLGLILPSYGVNIRYGETWGRVATNSLDLVSGEYSPLPSLLVMIWQSVLGTSSQSAFLYKTLLLIICLFFFWNSTQIMWAKRTVTVTACYFLILSPYLMWTFYNGRDTDVDIVSVSIMMWFIARVYRKPTLLDVIFLGLASALAVTMRESNLIVLPSLVSVLRVIGKINWRHFLTILLAYIIGLIPLFTVNFIATQTITVSTRTGINLYLGNHPFLLYGHPLYDHEGYLGQRMGYDLRQAYPNYDSFSKTEQNNLARDQAIDLIKEDPIGAIYRSLIKSWWWIGPLRVPQTDALGRLGSDRNVITIEREAEFGKELLYVVHRFTILGLILLYWKQSDFDWRRTLIFILPIFALIPVAALTTPDTRYRLAYDPYWYSVAAMGFVSCIELVVRWRN